MALIDSASPAQKRLLESVLPTAAQIKRVANDSWDLALELAGMKRAQPQQQRAHPMLSLLWHYYETKKSIPSENKLRAYANGDLGKAMPKRRGRGFPDFVEELVAARQERGWTTPKDGPLDGETLPTAEFDALLDGASDWKPRERWTEDAVLACFVEFVREFLGKKDLRVRLYQGVRVTRQWPSENAFGRYGTFSWCLERAKQVVMEEAAGEKAA
jgi:hypothetical protein